MLSFSADPRNNIGTVGSSCTTCCCENFSMTPGEQNLLLINYAPWSLPIGGPGIVPTPEFYVEERDSSCSTEAVDGFAAPANTAYSLATALNTVLAIDLTAGATPAANTFTFEIVPLQGPYNGTLTMTANGQYNYTPVTGFQGYDYFYYKMTDAQGREVIQSVTVNVGTHNDTLDATKTAETPQIIRTAVQIDQSLQTMRVPILMPVLASTCEMFRLTIKQPARDCAGNVFYHYACFDIVPASCG